MSKIFKVDEDKQELQRGSYKLDTDLYAGFKRAAGNNQMYLAFEYLTLMMEILDQKLDALVPEVNVVDEPLQIETPESVTQPKFMKAPKNQKTTEEE